MLSAWRHSTGRMEIRARCDIQQHRTHLPRPGHLHTDISLSCRDAHRHTKPTWQDGCHEYYEMDKSHLFHTTLWCARAKKKVSERKQCVLLPASFFNLQGFVLSLIDQLGFAIFNKKVARDIYLWGFLNKVCPCIFSENVCVWVYCVTQTIVLSLWCFHLYELQG